MYHGPPLILPPHQGSGGGGIAGILVGLLLVMLPIAAGGAGALVGYIVGFMADAVTLSGRAGDRRWAKELARRGFTVGVVLFFALCALGMLLNP
jgi:hypothetical protein